jgi:NarL family two-component system response regulator LiaR
MDLLMNESIRILICDDHNILRKGLRSLFDAMEGLQVVGEASDGREAAEKARLTSPDVILMDLLMPEMNGVEAIRQIKKEGSKTKILVLTSYNDNDLIMAAIQSGIDGYILKTSSPEELVDAIRKVYRGESILSAQATGSLFSSLRGSREQPVQLTQREIEVLNLVGKGCSNREIAVQLHITENTVISHMGRILEKLHLENRTQAALYAKRIGLN